MIKEIQLQGIELAKQRGIYKGRPFSNEVLGQVIQLTRKRQLCSVSLGKYSLYKQSGVINFLIATQE